MNNKNNINLQLENTTCETYWHETRRSKIFYLDKPDQRWSGYAKLIK
jgi:hypothetical protein